MLSDDELFGLAAQTKKKRQTLDGEQVYPDDTVAQNDVLPDIAPAEKQDDLARMLAAAQSPQTITKPNTGSGQLEVGGVTGGPEAEAARRENAANIGGTGKTYDAIVNPYGGKANLDPSYMRQQVVDGFKRLGYGSPSESQIAEILKYASRPDVFSDNTTHVGVNDYWIKRIAEGSAAGNPQDAGSDTLLSNYTGALPDSGFNADHGMVGLGASAPSYVAPVTPSASTTPAATTAPTPTLTFASSAGPTKTPQQQAEDDAIHAALMRALNGPSPDEIAKDASNSAAVAGFRRSTDRDYGKARAQAAEDAAQTGTISSGGFEGQKRQLESDRIEKEAAYEGTQARQAQQDRQSELTNAIQLAMQRGQFADAQQLQQRQFVDQLGFNYSQLSQQQRQFLASLDQNADQFLKSLGLSYAQLDSNQRQALAVLAENQRQYDKSSIYNYDVLNYNKDKDATLTALSGGGSGTGGG